MEAGSFFKGDREIHKLPDLTDEELDAVDLGDENARLIALDEIDQVVIEGRHDLVEGTRAQVPKLIKPREQEVTANHAFIPTEAELARGLKKKPIVNRYVDSNQGKPAKGKSKELELEIKPRDLTPEEERVVNNLEDFSIAFPPNKIVIIYDKNGLTTGSTKQAIIQFTGQDEKGVFAKVTPDRSNGENFVQLSARAIVSYNPLTPERIEEINRKKARMNANKNVKSVDSDKAA